MTLTQLLDRYVQGGQGEYWFNIDVVHGHDISGGMFSRKRDARMALLNRLVAFLDDPQTATARQAQKAPRRAAASRQA